MYDRRVREDELADRIRALPRVPRVLAHGVSGPGNGPIEAYLLAWGRQPLPASPTQWVAGISFLRDTSPDGAPDGEADARRIITMWVSADRLAKLPSEHYGDLSIVYCDPDRRRPSLPPVYPAVDGPLPHMHADRIDHRGQPVVDG